MAWWSRRRDPLEGLEEAMHVEAFRPEHEAPTAPLKTILPMTIEGLEGILDSRKSRRKDLQGEIAERQKELAEIEATILGLEAGILTMREEQAILTNDPAYTRPTQGDTLWPARIYADSPVSAPAADLAAKLQGFPDGPPCPSCGALFGEDHRAECISILHPYSPSSTHMGDCSVCGNTSDHPSHNFLRQADYRELAGLDDKHEQQSPQSDPQPAAASV